MTGQARAVVCYYYEPVKAPLLRACVVPALRAVPPGVLAHVERGWLYGPHVRIALDGEPATVTAEAARIRDRVTDHLRENPSTVRPTHADLLRAATAAGRAELVPPPYEPFQPDNTVRIEEPDPAAIARLPRFAGHRQGQGGVPAGRTAGRRSHAGTPRAPR